MKKLTTLAAVAALFFAVTGLLAQDVYTGGAIPPGNKAQDQTHKFPVTAVQSGISMTSSMEPANFMDPDLGNYSGTRDVLCNPCAKPEGEADIPDYGIDVTNGGCNFNPFLSLPIHIGSVYCGRCNGYITETSDARDTDWYLFTLTETKTVYFSGIANFNAVFYLIVFPDCAGHYVYASAAPSPGTVGNISATLPAGTYVCFVAPVGFGSNPAYDGDYMIRLSDTPAGEPATWCPSLCLYCGIPEGEAPNQDEIGDMTNYGCNGAEFDPDRPPVFSPIQINDVICGSGDHYTIGNTQYRDTDWYRFVLTSKTQLYWSGVADFAITLIIIEGPCNTQVSHGLINLAPDTYGTITALLDPGEYYFWVGPSNWDFNNNGNYMVTLTEAPPGDPSNWCTHPLVPLSDWALFIGIGLILLAAVIRFRKIL